MQDQLRKQFPALHQTIYGKPLVYLDNAATTLKPQGVVDAIGRYYSSETANVHRGVYYLSEKATDAYERTRSMVQCFINARAPEEIIFVRGTTEAINLAASSYAAKFLKSGDEIVLSAIEHHSNIVPWQFVCEIKGTRLRIAPVNDAGELIVEDFEKLLKSRNVKLVAIGHVSNALGTIHPIRQIIKIAHDYGSVVLIDGAQAVAHIPVDVQDLNCDFYAFSGHKMFGPTGIGVLYGKERLLEMMPPYQGGGEMIHSVTFEKTTYHELPHKFEAGTPAIAEVIGLGAAIEFIRTLQFSEIIAHEQRLLDYATKRIRELNGIRIIGTAKEKAAILSFVAASVHPHDLGTMLDRDGIAIRAGHHCAMPAMERFGIPATARASFVIYNTEEEIDRFIDSLKNALSFFE